MSERAMKVVPWLAAVLALLFVGGGLILQAYGKEILSNNLILIGIGTIIAIIPWMQTFQLGMDGIQLTTIRSSSAKIADNLQKTVDETKNAISSLQSQINTLREEIALQGGLPAASATPPEEDNVIAQATKIYSSISGAMGNVIAMLKSI